MKRKRDKLLAMAEDGKSAARNGSDGGVDDAQAGSNEQTGSNEQANDGGSDGDSDDDSHDRLFVHSKVEDGEGYHVIRSRPGQVEIGELRQMRAGKPISGEVVKLTPTEDHDRLFDVEVLASPPQRRSHAGPANVTSNAYREQWDAIFGSKGKGTEEPSELN